MRGPGAQASSQLLLASVRPYVRSSLPSTATVWTLITPPTLVQNARACPSGDQAGSEATAPVKVICRGSPPLIGSVKMFLPFSSLTKASDCRSGERCWSDFEAVPRVYRVVSIRSPFHGCSVVACIRLLDMILSMYDRLPTSAVMLFPML